MGNSFPVPSSQCHTSSAVLAGEGWRACFSAIHDQIFSIGDRSRDRLASATIEYPMYLGMSEHDVRNAVTLYLVKRWCLVNPEDRAQSLDVRSQKCTYLRSQIIVDPN
ncbi:hypothetical protein TNCV_3717541 [Trichonephila clavipes]|nr:hypothetical protein TNCV_3717541 [Trichonephila clavipes]